MKYADLHVHTNASDGTSTPEELVRLAAQAGHSAIAITDHDTLDGIAPALAQAPKLGLEVIPGVELTSQHQGREIHILGYFLDYKDGRLLESLASIRQSRVERVYKIADKLKSLGVALEPDAVFRIAGKAAVGRMHIARALLESGKIASTAEAFHRYIGDKSPAYVLNFKFSAQEAISLIKSSGGAAVLAHPYIINNDEFIREFAAYGLDGLEVYYPEHSQSMVNFYLKQASELNLAVTGGTDFHGKAKPEIKLGSIKIPYSLVEKLKANRA